jgi:hypothetical protein
LLYVSNLNFDDLLLVRATTKGVVYCTEVIYGARWGWGVMGEQWKKNVFFAEHLTLRLAE